MQTFTFIQRLAATLTRHHAITHRLLMSVALVLTLPLVGCASHPLPDQREIDLIATQNYQGLAHYYSAQLSTHPDDDALMMKLTDAYFHSNDIESALFYTRHLRAGGYASNEFLLLAGKVYMAGDENQAALAAFQQAQQQGYQGADMNISLGVLYASLAQFDNAIAQFNQARMKGYDDVSVKNNIGVVYIAQHHYQQAISMLTPLYKAAPSHPRVRINLAVALIKTQDYATARQLLANDYDDAEFNKLIKDLAVL